MKLFITLWFFVGIFIMYCSIIVKNRKRKKILKYIITPIFGIILIVGVIIFTPNANDFNCDKRWVPFKEKQISGLIVKKIKDMRHFTYPFIYVKNFDNEKIDTVCFFNSASNMYNLLYVSDTIYKNKNNDTISIIRDGQTKFIQRLDCGCDTNSYIKKHRHSPDGNYLNY